MTYRACVLWVEACRDEAQRRAALWGPLGRMGGLSERMRAEQEPTDGQHTETAATQFWSTPRRVLSGIEFRGEGEEEDGWWLWWWR